MLDNASRCTWVMLMQRLILAATTPTNTCKLSSEGCRRQAFGLRPRQLHYSCLRGLRRCLLRQSHHSTPGLCIKKGQTRKQVSHAPLKQPSPPVCVLLARTCPPPCNR